MGWFQGLFGGGEGAPEASSADVAWEAFKNEHDAQLSQAGLSSEQLLLAKRMFMELFKNPHMSADDVRRNLGDESVHVYEKMKAIMEGRSPEPSPGAPGMEQPSAMDSVDASSQVEAQDDNERMAA